MLIVRIISLPGGDASRAEDIAVLEIANLSDLAPVSDYSVSCESADVHRGLARSRGFVRGHERARGALHLLRRALGALLDAEGSGG